jgi:hypothetical protein
MSFIVSITREKSSIILLVNCEKDEDKKASLAKRGRTFFFTFAFKYQKLHICGRVIWQKKEVTTIPILFDFLWEHKKGSKQFPFGQGF